VNSESPRNPLEDDSLFTLTETADGGLVVGFGAKHFAPVEVAPLQTHNKHFSTGQIGGNGNIMFVAVANGFNHLGIVPGLGGIGIGEQKNEIDLVIGDPGVDLLMTALLMAQQQCYGQIGIVSNQAAGGCGGEQIMLDQNTFISGAELDHQFFLFIMSQKRNIQTDHSFVVLPDRNGHRQPLNSFCDAQAGFGRAFFCLLQQRLSKGSGQCHIRILRHDSQ